MSFRAAWSTCASKALLSSLIGASLCSALGDQAYAQADETSAAFLGSTVKVLGGAAVKDVMLTGTAEQIAGSSMQNVPFTIQTLLSGSVQFKYGAQTETRVVDSNGIWQGSWTDTEGKVHPLAYHNMMAEPSWFFPMLSTLRALNSSGGPTVTYVGAETFRGTAVQHVRFVYTSSTDPQLQALAQSELYLDAVTLLPVGLTYNDHPDKSLAIDIPVTILYSGYQTLGGLLVATHVQQFRNNALSLDLAIQNVALNTGLTISAPVTE